MIHDGKTISVIHGNQIHDDLPKGACKARLICNNKEMKCDIYDCHKDSHYDHLVHIKHHHTETFGNIEHNVFAKLVYEVDGKEYFSYVEIQRDPHRG